MRILLVATRHPWPVRRGDQLRAAQFVTSLVAEHRVVLLTPAAAGAVSPPRALLEGGLEVEAYHSHLGDRCRRGLEVLRNGAPLQSALFGSADLGRRIRRLAPSCDLAISQLVRLEGHLADFGATPLYIDLIDCLSLTFERRAERDHRWLRGLWRFEAARLLRSECRVLRRAVAACVVCERDRRHLEARLGREITQHLQVVPLAMTTDRVPVSESGSSVGETILLTGNLGYFPNRRAARMLLREVWPRLRARRPHARFVLAGDRVPRSLERLARSSGAELLAAPAELRAVLGRAAVALAPADSGAGFPVKVLEAWQAGVPVVASPWAADGAGGRPGEELLVAEGPDPWIASIEAILEDPAVAARLREGGLRRARECHSAAVLTSSLSHFIGAVRRS